MKKACPHRYVHITNSKVDVTEDFLFLVLLPPSSGSTERIFILSRVNMIHRKMFVKHLLISPHSFRSTTMEYVPLYFDSFLLGYFISALDQFPLSNSIKFDTNGDSSGNVSEKHSPLTQIKARDTWPSFHNSSSYVGVFYISLLLLLELWFWKEKSALQVLVPLQPVLPVQEQKSLIISLITSSL